MNFKSIIAVTMLILASNSSAKDYHFTTDWFEDRKEIFRKQLGPLAGKENLRYLEVGVFEGRSFFWVMDNILTSKDSKGYAVDLFDPEPLKTFKSNLKTYGKKGKVKFFKGSSLEVLPKLPKKYFDFVYVDGSHVAKDSFEDLKNSWKSLKDGGIVIFDDYILGKGIYSINMRPQIALDYFLTSHFDEVEVLYYNPENLKVESQLSGVIPYPVVIKKLSNPCNSLNSDFVFKGNVWTHCQRMSESLIYLWDYKLVNHKTKTEYFCSKEEFKQINEFYLAIGNLNPSNVNTTNPRELFKKVQCLKNIQNP